MLQHWLNIAGLAFDFVGVLLLAYEWWIALKADERESQILRQERLRDQTMAMHRQNNPGYAAHERLNQDMTFNSRLHRAAEARGMRRGYFVLALVLIAAGFLLQIAGSWPYGFGI